MKNEKGITLTSLMAMILVLLLLSSITIKMGTESYDVMKANLYVSKLQVIQGKVDNIVEENSNISDLGFTTLKSIEGTEDYNVFANIIENPSKYNIDTEKSWDDALDSDIDNYYYFTASDLEKIGLSNQDVTVVINFETRNVIEKNGFEDEGKTYYRQYDLAGGEQLFNTQKDEIETANYYYHKNAVEFDGTNYIDTGICLFSKENIDKDFEVSFEIESRGSNSQYATMISAMDESGSPWPGIVYRVNSSTQDQFCANATSSLTFGTFYTASTVQKVTLKRTSKILYINFNDGTDTKILDLTTLTKTFNAPVAFGASLDGSLNPQRYFKGTLSNLMVRLY